MSTAKPTARLRELLGERGILSLPGVHDCLMAKLVEATGFPGAFIGDGAVSVTRLGRPDFGYLDRGEVVERAREICRCTSLPVIVDIGTGYGNALSVQRTVEEVEAAGASGVFFEDQVAPKKCGHMAGRSLVSRAEMVMKVRAAADARRDPDFVLVARTDALAAEGFESAIERIEAYGEAGADVVFIDALETLDQVARAPRRTRFPLMANMAEGGKTPYLSAGELERLGYKIVIWPETLMYAAFGAMQRVAQELAAQGIIGERTRAGMTDLFRLSEFLGLRELYELEARYAHD